MALEEYSKPHIVSAEGPKGIIPLAAVSLAEAAAVAGFGVGMAAYKASDYAVPVKSKLVLQD